MTSYGTSGGTIAAIAIGSVALVLASVVLLKMNMQEKERAAQSAAVADLKQVNADTSDDDNINNQPSSRPYPIPSLSGAPHAGPDDLGQTPEPTPSDLDEVSTERGHQVDEV